MCDKYPEPTHRQDADMAVSANRSVAPFHEIGWAIKQLWHGQKVTRRGWNGRDQWLALQTPDHNSKMSLPYIYIRTVDGNLVPWLASQTDILATDWQLSEAN